MAYAALTSLNQTMKRFLCIFYLLDLSPPQILDSACYEVQELQNFLRARKKSTSRDAFYGEIRDAARKLEYALEIHLSNQIRLYQSAKRVDHGDLIIDIQHSQTDLDGVVNQEIVSFTEKMKKLRQLRDDEEDAAAAVSSSTNITPCFPGLMKSPNIVGLADVFKEIYNQLETEEHGNTTILLGMAGIGKTAIALKLFDDLRSNYEISAFVTVGPECKSKEIMLRALAQMNCVDIDKISKEPDDMVAKCLLTSLTHRRYLIVFDDLWSIDCFKEIKLVLPYNRNGSRILVTTRLWEVARCYYYVRVRFLTEQESWDLLREKVFGTKESCPFELEKAGRKIAEKCDGLPLTIITVAPLLSRVERTPEAWNKEAEKGSSIFAEAYDEMFEVLFLSYKYLDQNVKACFLYIGVFPEKFEIPCSKLIKLWKVEGFFNPNSDFLPFEDYAWNCVRKLFQNNLVLGQGRRSCQATSKSCRLHSAYWHFCSREARNEKLFHIINSYAANNSFCIQDIIRSEQRLCIHNNTLLGFKEVYEYSVEPNTNSTVRSLLCTGPHHHYPVPIRLQCFRLLRVLNALTVRFYEFLMEVVGLYLLRYLALTSNRELPASISKLWSLEYLIIHQHLCIKSPRVNSYLPMEIWCMEELDHLEVMGFDLPDPIYDGDAPSLRRLSTLLGVSPKS